MKGNWLDPKIYKPKDGANVLTKSIVDDTIYYHVAWYDSANNGWYTNNDDLMYSEYIIGWMYIPE